MIKKLRLGPLPKTKVIRITIVISAQLKDTLDRYAALHSEATGEKNEVARLIPHMLESFMAEDRAFRAAGRNRAILKNGAG
jgi:hypothetical protein